MQPEVFPRVSVDKGSVDEFVDGIFGKNKASNKAAMEKGAALVAAVAIVSHSRRAKRARRGP
jgi:hypothetical protein